MSKKCQAPLAHPDGASSGMASARNTPGHPFQVLERVVTLPDEEPAAPVDDVWE